MNILDIAIAKKLAGGGGGSGTDNYNDLSNLPKINDTTLSGNKSSSALGLQSEINSDSKLASDLVDDTNQDNKFVTSTEKNTWNAKQNAIDSDHKLSSDLVDDANKTNKFVTSTEKNTWNAKQNAIDSEHKLSSSLVSFTDAEAAALASGIDSSKVGQISTNQTNILYALQTGVKNIIPLQIISGKYDSDRCTITNNGDGSFTVNMTEAASQNLVFTCTAKGSFEFEIGKKYVLSGCAEGGSLSTYYLIWSGGGNTADTGSGVTYTPTANYTAISFVIMAGATVTNKTFWPMLCTEDAWNQEPNVFRPYALPNSDLTYLEAEDRAALAEEIDAGAKNKLPNLGVQTNGDITYTWNNNGSVTVSGTKTAGTENYVNVIDNVAYSALGFKAGDTLVFSNDNANVHISVIFYKSGSGYTSAITVQNESKEITLPSDRTNILVRLAVNSASSSVNETIKPMICTKAAFGVSQKFVPYRPNYDLVSYLANAGGFHDASHGSFVQNADLNSVANGIRLYHSPSNNPTSATYVLVKTYMLDSTTGVQELTSLASPPKMYTRVKMASTWGSWVETTNA